MEENEEKKLSLISFILIMIIIIAVIAIFGYVLSVNNKEKEKNIPNVETVQKTNYASKNEYALTDNNFSKFDLSFLKFENEKVNKIYSPLSIKYAFKMLEEAATGKAKEQISDIVQAYNLTKYKSSENMTLANAFFVKDTYKDGVKDDYIKTLKTKYDAEVNFDSFSSAEKINNWVKEHTLELIPEITDDETVKTLDFALVNALGIDMEWKHKFLEHRYEDDSNISWGADYLHVKIPNSDWVFSWMSPETLTSKKFNNNQKVSSMQVIASLNNYDIVKDLGEEKIRQTVFADFKDWALGEGKYKDGYSGHTDPVFKNDFSEENIKKVFDGWFDKGVTSFSYDDEGNLLYPSNNEDGKSVFIEALNANKNRVDYSTDFSVYVDENVKVFAKDLKEYDGTTLQYIGIMPIKEDLDNFISNTEYTDITNLINKLKELKKENFKDGYLTYIHGYIPKFKFDYELSLKEDLSNMGVTDVFEQGKASLTNLTDNEDAYITTAKHKSNIEFTQDGIKAAAATMVGGAGAGDWYDYLFEMPTEEIDITFDKPYMFLIRDKKTGETWFVGTVYEPLDEKDETDPNIYSAIEDRENQ